jgi:20S proteasome alpha/beta subunit
MTIATGFWCDDGIVLASDTQITYDTGYKGYESKMYEVRESDWTAIFTYAGVPDVMRKFYGTFLEDALHPKNGALTSSCKGLTKLIEDVLSRMAYDFRADPGRDLYMLAALAIPNKELGMIKTSNETVCIARPYEQIGVGDTALLRFLEKMVCQPTGTHERYVTAQALKLSVYLVYQAKQYIEGCGGATNVRILRPHGHFDVYDGATGDYEKEIEEIESRLSIAASLSFDERVPAAMLEQNWRIVIDQLQRGHA